MKKTSHIKEPPPGKEVIRACLERGTAEEVDLEYALKKLEGYWRKEDILPMLNRGCSLWTPYAEYRMKEGPKTLSA